MSETTKNPYLGPRTFEERHAHLFFGREREARNLLSTVISEPLVLFYAPSGAGKSSLINARLAPGLRQEGFHVLPTGRIGGAPSAERLSADNIFVYNLLASVHQDQVPAADLPFTTLAAFIRQIRDSLDDPGLPLVLIVDQFEELVTTYQAFWHQRRGFFWQLNQALEADSLLWVVLSLREDYMAAVEPYARDLPGRLMARFQMERMRAPAALEAITRPAADHGRPFAEGVADILVDNLRQIRTHEAEGQGLGEFVEPVQLQVVCYQLWENLRGRPAGEITAADVAELGNVDQALGDFYQRTLADVLPGSDLTELELRNWFERQLITEDQTRGTVYQGPEETAGLPNEIVRQLADHYLLRSELRAGGTWYELVHDRLVSPILLSNAAWRDAQGPALKAAEAWQEAGRPEQGLYEGSQLEEALASLDEDTAQPLVKEFLAASQAVQEKRDAERARQLAEAQAEAEEQKQRADEQARASRRFRLLALGLLFVLVVAITFMAFAISASSRADRASARNLALAGENLALNNSNATAQAANKAAATANAVLVTSVAAMSSARTEDVANARSTASAAAVAADVARATAESANMSANATAESVAAPGDLTYQVVNFNTGVQAPYLKPGETFSPTWTIRNTGSDAWSGDFQLVYVDRQVSQTRGIPRDRMAGEAAYTLKELAAIDAVEPGQLLALTLKMTAPVDPGMYASHWELRDPSGSAFGLVLWVMISVQAEYQASEPALILDVPYRSQYARDAASHISDDGPAALAMMLNAAGVDISVDEIYKRHLPDKASRDFTLASELISVARAEGLDVTYNAKDTNEIEASSSLRAALNDGRPFIALISYGAWREITGSPFTSGHFVLVVGYDQDHIYVHDSYLGTDETPYRGAYLQVPNDMFFEGWGGFDLNENPIFSAITPDQTIAQPLDPESDIFKSATIGTNATRLLDVPYRSQWAEDAGDYAIDGGATAVTMLLNATGVDITPDKFHKIMPTIPSDGFATMTNLIKGAEANGLDLEYIPSDGPQQALARLRVSVAEGKPFLALVNYEPWREFTGNDLSTGAYVLVVGFDSDSIIVHDPLFGNWVPAEKGAYLDVPLSLFLEGWGSFASRQNPNWAGLYPTEPVVQP
jgi:hypothetical protein